VNIDISMNTDIKLTRHSYNNTAPEICTLTFSMLCTTSCPEQKCNYQELCNNQIPENNKHNKPTTLKTNQSRIQNNVQRLLNKKNNNAEYTAQTHDIDTIKHLTNSPTTCLHRPHYQLVEWHLNSHSLLFRTSSEPVTEPVHSQA